MKWSFSADRCFRRCQRQYYFREVVAHHAARKNPLRREAFLLRQLKGPEQWRGLLVHAGIEQFVVPRLQAGAAIAWDAVVAGTLDLAWRQFRFSEARRYREEGLTKTAAALDYCALAAHEGGGTLPPETLDRVFAAVEAALRNLAGMNELLTLLRARARLRAEVPVVVKYDGVNVEARIDLLGFRGFGKPTVVEWKTYEDPGDDAGLQAALYAWALCRSDAWRVSRPEDVELIEAQLLTGQVMRHPCNEAVFEELEDRVYQSVGAIRALCGDGKFEGLDLAEFAYASNPNSCRFCPFRRLCLAGA